MNNHLAAVAQDIWLQVNEPDPYMTQEDRAALFAAAIQPYSSTEIQQIIEHIHQLRGTH